MALEASIVRPKSGGAIRGRRLPTPTTAWDIPEQPPSARYPRMNYSETWVITGATSTTNLYEASQAVNLPQPGSAGIVENGMTLSVVSSVDPVKTDNETVWNCTVNYETNPLILPLEINIMTSHYQREKHVGIKRYTAQPTNTSANETTIKNACGDPYDRPIVDDEAATRIELIKRMQSFNYQLPTQYACRQNGKPFMGLPIGKVYCSDIRAVLTYDPITHYLVTACFEIRDQYWAHRITETGTRWYEYENSTYKLRTSRDDYGQTDCKEVFLNSDGTKMDMTASGATPKEVWWDTIPYADFTRLPFFS